MGKNRRDDDVPRITINVGDLAPEPNPTLLALLRDGEKIKPSDARGTLADRLGAETQAFLAYQTKVANYRRCAVKGTITIAVAVTSGPDGSHTYSVESKDKRAKIPAGVSMTYAGADGELTGRPVEPLTQEMYKREAAKSNGGASPKVGGASNL